MNNSLLNEGWNGLDKTPPDEVVEIMDENGNTGHGNPTYYPFEVVKMKGDEAKPWGWRGTPVFYEDGKSKWDGGWMIYATMEISNIGDVKYWRKINN